ncbi:MAG: hypothetical protein QOJ35_1841 [Solirubrobacteraceae bacterium]|jgi:hypothetical protein|nr:hypothetical protein [Solirubrobacteraceae bacterium]
MTPAGARALTRLVNGAGARVARIAPRRVLAVGTLALLALRIAISLARTGPVVMADEAGYLLNARILAGGMPAQMGSSPFYRGGYSLLIAPILSLDGDPVAAYHAVLVLNALLAACLVPLLYLLLTRCVDVSPAVAAWAALAGAAYPSVTVLSQVALSENALFALTVAWLLCIGLAARGGLPAAVSIGWAAAIGLSAAALWTVHGRMVVAVGVTALGLVFAAARRRLGVAAAGAGLAALACGMLAGRLLDDWLLATNYAGDAHLDELKTALAPLHDADGMLAVVRNLAGQGWYLLTATLGIVLLVAPLAVARLRTGRGRPGDVVLAAMLMATAGLLVVSALWFATTTRPDQLIYGRYVEPLVPALVAVGLALLVRAERGVPVRALVAGLAALTVVVAALRVGADVPGEASRWNVAALPSVTGDLGAPVIALGGIVACAALCALAFVARRRPGALAPLAIALFVPTTAYGVYLPVLRSQRDVYPAGWTSPRPVAERLGAQAVGYDLDRFDHVRVKVYQWFMPHTRVVLFHGADAGAPARVFFSARRLSGRLARPPAVAVWTDPGADQALWRRAP